jgi:hypothetical protein
LIAAVITRAAPLPSSKFDQDFTRAHLPRNTPLGLVLRRAARALKVLYVAKRPLQCTHVSATPLSDPRPQARILYMIQLLSSPPTIRLYCCVCVCVCLGNDARLGTAGSADEACLAQLAVRVFQTSVTSSL